MSGEKHFRFNNNKVSHIPSMPQWNISVSRSFSTEHHEAFSLWTDFNSFFRGGFFIVFQLHVGKHKSSYNQRNVKVEELRMLQEMSDSPFQFSLDSADIRSNTELHSCCDTNRSPNLCSRVSSVLTVHHRLPRHRDYPQSSEVWAELYLIMDRRQ